MAELSPEANAELANYFVKMANNPETRKETARLAKKAGLNLSLPDVEASDQREYVDQKLADRDAQDNARKAKEHLESQRARLLDRYDEKSVKEIEALMEKEGIANYDTAARLFAADTKPATPRSEIKSRTWEMPKISKEDVNNIASRARTNAYDVIDQIQASKRR